MENTQTLRSCLDLVAQFNHRNEKDTASRLHFYGAGDNKDVYNITAPFEDGGAQYMPVIEEHFGKHVLDLVMACSDAAPQRGQPKGAWIERKEKYIANLRSAADEVLLISAADKWHNLASILADAKQLGEVVFDRFIRQDFERTDKKKMVLWYYKELLAVYRERNVPVVVELENLLSEIENVTGQKR